MILKLKKNYSKCFLISILFFCVFQSETVFASREPIIRVLISKNNNIRIRSDKLIPLTIDGKIFSNKKIKGLTLKNEKNRKILYFDKNKQKIYDLKSNQQFQVRSSDGRGIWVGQKRFSGKIDLFILDSEILVVNVLGIEKYLSSVVGSEMPIKWPMEALKAQAIASRTYALKQKGNNLFDIDSTQRNQVYNGLESRTYKTIRAVKSTRSLVLTYKNKLINALFHSSSGGMTENSQDVWKNKYPYLSSVKDFDKKNPKFRWQRKFSDKELTNLFPKIGGLKNIEILNITSTGRVKNVKLIGAYGSDQMSGVDLRKKLGLNSNFVRFKFFDEELNNKVPKKKGLIVFGQGSGHGVGMSQWGAKYMASKGQKAENILKYFYRGVQVKPFKKDYL
ncbi:MAG: SpoIID/LytB domain-containing protein [Prochlorococcus marinus CUG1439]|uniref:SpoIID/LytB domain-containing protein n=1 Tax=Prochlorococcus sp. MIT 1314 TaxID=3096220 RepID=UPI001B21B624|nr:SpoIID/LytB domain-containing protein [Prochlorococcus sp. MIT 1314]MCR8538912.1 SpoIID/LytB domain-containing protein [Prochlorococcus marinus CUG1439]